MSDPVGSEYLRWAKLHAEARFNLTSSGMPPVSLRDLPGAMDDVELWGSGAYGWPPLQRAISARYGVPEECIVQAMGTSMANYLAMAALLRPGDEVLIEHPGYEPLLAAARHLGADVSRFERRAEDGFRVDPDEVRRRMGPRTRMVVITNLHNPSSALTDEETLREVGRVAAEAGARVLVVEVYLDALFGPPRTAFHLGEPFVTTSSLTKVYGLSGLRCGWIFAEPALAERMWRLTELLNNVGAAPAERLSVAAFRHLDSIAARSRAILDANRAALNAFYRTRGDLEWIEHGPGTISFPRVRSGRVDELCTLLRERYETTVVPGGFFGMPDRVRIGLGTEPAAFAAGLECLGRALDELR